MAFWPLVMESQPVSPTAINISRVKGTTKARRMGIFCDCFDSSEMRILINIFIKFHLCGGGLVLVLPAGE
jgi:hypothetical protein